MTRITPSDLRAQANDLRNCNPLPRIHRDTQDEIDAAATTLDSVADLIETMTLAPAVTVTEGWKPIETAPKDGNEPLLLAFRDGDGRLEVYIGRYCGALGVWCDDNCGDVYLATHWQPLPPPPSTTPQTGSQE